MINRLLWLMFILIFMLSGYYTTTKILYLLSFICIAIYYTGLYAFIHLEHDDKEIDDFFEARQSYLEQENLNMVCANCLHLFFVFTIFHGYGLCIIIALSVLIRSFINERLVKEFKEWRQ